MWVLTRGEWPVLVNLAVTASVGYFQVAKFDQRMHVVATAWEAEHVLADCTNGEEARAVIRLLAAAIANDRDFLDLNATDASAIDAKSGGSVSPTDVGVATA